MRTRTTERRQRRRKTRSERRKRQRRRTKEKNQRSYRRPASPPNKNAKVTLAHQDMETPFRDVSVCCTRVFRASLLLLSFAEKNLAENPAQEAEEDGPKKNNGKESDNEEVDVWGCSAPPQSPKRRKQLDTSEPSAEWTLHRVSFDSANLTSLCSQVPNQRREQR